MHKDEHDIRKLVDDWMLASIAGDLDKMLNMLDEDVMFMVPGREPFDKQEFAANFRAFQETMEIEGDATFVELKVLDDWAYGRVRLNMKMIPRGGGAVVRRSGYTLSIYRKDSRGNWLLHRDANLMPPPK